MATIFFVFNLYHQQNVSGGIFVYLLTKLITLLNINWRSSLVKPIYSAVIATETQLIAETVMKLINPYSKLRYMYIGVIDDINTTLIIGIYIFFKYERSGRCIRLRNIYIRANWAINSIQKCTINTL